MTPYLDESWARVGPRIESLVATGQQRAAARAPGDVQAMLTQQGLSVASEAAVNVGGLVGVASDGRGLGSLLYQSLVVAGTALNTGTSAGAALAEGWDWLEGAISTEVADAYRVAGGLQTLVSPAAQWGARVVNPGACSRCILLAGRVTSDLRAFKRHPKCRCINAPLGDRLAEGVGTDPMEYFNALTTQEQDRVFTKAGAQAIRDGADMGQVVNARRGMTTTADGRLVTTEGMTRRGYAHHVMGQNPNWRVQSGSSATRFRVKAQRLMPEQIYKIARDPAEAKRLLQAYGYITPGPAGTLRGTIRGASVASPPKPLAGGAAGGGQKPPGKRIFGTPMPDRPDRSWLTRFGDRPPFLPPPSWESSSYWRARASALNVGFDLDEIVPHEVRFHEKFTALGHEAAWIARDKTGRRSTNDFVWVDHNKAVEFKRAPAKYKPIADHITRAVEKAAAKGIVKDTFIIDVLDAPVTDLLRDQLSKYNLRRPSARIRELWVMSKGELIQIPLKK